MLAALMWSGCDTDAVAAPLPVKNEDGFVGVRGVCGFVDVPAPKCVCLLIISTGVSAVSPSSTRSEVSESYARVSFGGFRSKKGGLPNNG